MVAINQTLHGYHDGHELLAHSLDLTGDQESALLLMSDLSGTNYVKGFDGYLTGYPIPGGRYCIARTWFASELPRPGCVWTHSLLIDDAALAQLADVRQILSLFRRPPEMRTRGDRQSVLAQYERRVSVANRESSLMAPPRDHVMRVLTALYESVEPRAIVATTADEYEAAILAVFSQGWPRLRRNLRFCTGLLSGKNKEFDIAIFPGSPESSRIKFSEAWLDLAADDALAGTPSGKLRQFLWRFGPDYKLARTAYVPLCDIFVALTAQESAAVSQTSHDHEAYRFDRVLSAASAAFPDSGDSHRLKEQLFGRIKGMPRSLSEEGQILRVLVEHPRRDCIPDDVAQIRSRAAHLAVDAPEAATRIAERAHIAQERRALEYLSGYAAAFEMFGDTRVAPHVSVGLAGALLDLNPALAARAEIWQRDVAEQVRLAVHLRNEGIERLREAAEAMVAADAFAALGVLWEFDANAVLEQILAKAEGKGGAIALPKQLVELLQTHRHDVVAMAVSRRTARSLKVATGFVDARWDAAKKHGAALWANALEAPAFADPLLETTSDTFLLAIAFAATDKASAQLITARFSRVYDSIEAGTLPGEAWEMLEAYLPWYVPSWDRCARIVRAAVALFVDRKVSPSQFLRTFVSEAQLRQAIAEADRTWSGTRYMRSVCVLRAEFEPTTFQARLLGGYLRQ